MTTGAEGGDDPAKAVLGAFRSEDAPEAVKPSRAAWLDAAEIGIACRAITLGASVAASVIYTLQLLFASERLDVFISANRITELGRHLMLVSMVAAGACGAVAVAVAIAWAVRRRVSVSHVERVIWLVSPLAALSALPILLRQPPWVDRTAALLVTIGLVALLIEGSVARSLEAFHDLGAPRPGFVSRLSRRVSEPTREHAATALVLLCSVWCSAYLSQLAIRRHHHFQSGVYDLGISDNLMFNALAGHFMRSPIFSGVNPGATSFIANHAQFGQYVLLPVYAFSPRSETLLALQCTLLAMSAVPLYFFCRKRVSPLASAVVALAYLAFPAMHGAALFEMTYIPVATFFVMATIWALDAERWILCALSFACAVSMREDIPIGLAVAGFAFAMAGHRPRAGLLLAAASTVYFVVVRFVVMDRAGNWIFPETLYGELLPPGETASFAAVIRTVVTNPTFVLSKLLREDKFTYLLQLLVPLAFLPLRRGWFMVALVPGVLLTLLSTNYAPLITVGFHYAMHWTPYLFLVVPVGLVVLARDARFGPAKGHAALCALAFASAVTTFHLGAFAKSPRFHVGFDNYDFTDTPAQRERYARLVKILTVIPRGATVAASNSIGPHVSNRVEAYLTDNDGLQGAEYLAFMQADFRYGKNREFLRRALSDGEYSVVVFDSDFVVLKRGPRNPDNDKVLQSWQP
jgi:uncharacterized membrane protein